MSITIGVTGASGLQYAFHLLSCLLKSQKQVNLILSPAAYVVSDQELGLKLPGKPEKLQQHFCDQFQVEPGLLQVFHHSDWGASIASGTTTCRSMVVVPCTSGCLAAIANGMSDNLIERAADVMLKEKRQLILVHRETPLNEIHLENSLRLARMGATIMPANPGFYHQPQSVEDLVDFIVARILDHLQVPHDLMARWGEST